MLYAIYIAAMLPGLFLRRESRVYDACVIGFCMVIVYINTTNADYDYYLPFYLDPSVYPPNLFEPGWQVACTIGRSLHISYNAFVSILVGLSMLLILVTCARLKVNRNILWTLFLIYPGLITFVQVRQTVAVAILLCACMFLSRDTKFGYVAFVVGALLASTFHRTSLFVLVLVAALLLQRGSARTRITLLAVAMAVIVFFSLNADSFLRPIFGDRLVTGYLSSPSESKTWDNEHTRMRMIGAAAIMIATFVISALLDAYLRRSVDMRGSGKTIAVDWLRFSRLAKYATLFFMVLIPVVLYSFNIVRLHRYAYVLMLVQFAIVMAQPSLKTWQRVLFTIGMVVFSCAAAYVLINSSNDLHTVTYSLMTFTGIPAPFL